MLPSTRAKLDRIEASQARIEALLHQLLNQGNKTMADLTALTAAVQNETTIASSAVTLIQGLAAQIAAAGTDPVALAALTTQLQSSATALSAAITANTPAAPPST